MIWTFDRTKLREARQEAGYSEANAAGRIEASKKQWQQWEQGVFMPTMRTLGKICSLFNREPNYFFVKNVSQNG